MPRFAAAHEIATLAAQPARSEPLSVSRARATDASAEPQRG